MGRSRVEGGIPLWSFDGELARTLSKTMFGYLHHAMAALEEGDRTGVGDDDVAAQDELDPQVGALDDSASR